MKKSELYAIAIACIAKNAEGLDVDTKWAIIGLLASEFSLQLYVERSDAEKKAAETGEVEAVW